MKKQFIFHHYTYNMIKKRTEIHSHFISLVGWLLWMITHEDKDLLGRVREAYLRVVL